MGLLDTLKQALGLQRPLVVHDAEQPLALTPAAEARLAALPPGHGIHVSTRPEGSGHVVEVEEGPSQGPPPEAWTGRRMTSSDADEALLRGLSLHHHDGRWAIQLGLELRAHETPNPDGRAYLCDRPLAVGSPLFFAAADGDAAPPPLAASLLAIPGVVSVLFRANTVTVNREPGLPWDSFDRAVDQALRQYFLFCGRPMLAERVRQIHDPLSQKVLRVLEQRVLPAIHKDGGDIELVGIERGVVRIRMQGACAGCPSSTATLHHGIEAALRQAFPGEIERVEAL